MKKGEVVQLYRLRDLGLTRREQLPDNAELEPRFDSRKLKPPTEEDMQLADDISELAT